MKNTDDHWYALFVRKRLTVNNFVVHVIKEIRGEGFTVLLSIVAHQFLLLHFAKNIIELGRPIVSTVIKWFIVDIYVDLIIEKPWRQKYFQKFLGVKNVIRRHI
tara:strand:- start:134 stop:445 length:312 start_codon:yes stop_codon:yes gene_type:complete